MTAQEVANDSAEELKKKYNLTDEALGEIAKKLSLATPEPATGTETTHRTGSEEGGLFGGMDDSEFKRMQGFMSGNEITLPGVILLTEMWDRQDRRREDRERRRDEEPAWAKRLNERIGVIEAKTAQPPTPTTPPVDTAAQQRFDDLKEQLKELRDDNKDLVTKLEKQAEEAKDEAQKQLIESKIGEVRSQLDAINSTLTMLKTPPTQPKDVVDQYLEAKDKLTKAGILKEKETPGVKSREELRATAQGKLLEHVDKGIASISNTFEEIKNSVIIPRLRVESGVANTSGLTQQQREDYYKRLNIAT